MKPTEIRYGKWFKIVVLIIFTWCSLDTIQGIYLIQPQDKPQETQIIQPSRDPKMRQRDRLLSKIMNMDDVEPKQPLVVQYPSKTSVLFGVYVLLATLIFLAMDGFIADITKLIYGQIIFALFFLLFVNDFGSWCSQILNLPEQVFRVGHYILFFFAIFVGFIMDIWISPYDEIKN